MTRASWREFSILHASRFIQTDSLLRRPTSIAGPVVGDGDGDGDGDIDGDGDVEVVLDDHRRSQTITAMRNAIRDTS